MHTIKQIWIKGWFWCIFYSLNKICNYVGLIKKAVSKSAWKGEKMWIKQIFHIKIHFVNYDGLQFFSYLDYLTKNCWEESLLGKQKSLNRWMAGPTCLWTGVEKMMIWATGFVLFNISCFFLLYFSEKL